MTLNGYTPDELTRAYSLAIKRALTKKGVDIHNLKSFPGMANKAVADLKNKLISSAFKMHMIKSCTNEDTATHIIEILNEDPQFILDMANGAD